MIEIEINARELQARIEQAAAKLENMRPLMQRIAGTLEHKTEANFTAQSRPSWAPRSKAWARRAARAHKTKWPRSAKTQAIEFFGAPDTIRTCDPCLRRAVLYPAELRARG